MNPDKIQEILDRYKTEVLDREVDSDLADRLGQGLETILRDISRAAQIEEKVDYNHIAKFGNKRIANRIRGAFSSENISTLGLLAASYYEAWINRDFYVCKDPNFTTDENRYFGFLQSMENISRKSTSAKS